MTAERKYFSGKSLEIALMHAARHHGLEPQEVAYRQIEKRHGFLRSRKGVVIEVDPASPRRTAAAQPPAEEPKSMPPVVEEAETAAAPIESVEDLESAVAERPETDAGMDVELAETAEAVGPAEAAEPAWRRSAVEPMPEATTEPETAARRFERDDDFSTVEPTEELREAARRGLGEIMSFAKLDLEVDVSDGEGQLEIELTGTDRPRLIEDRGNLLLAIQHLLPRLIRGYTGRSIPCRVDSEDFHAQREVELEKLALEAAEEVRDRQRPRTLPPMNPAERRIIHVTLADHQEVATESQGKGFFKRVTIRPAMRRPRGFDRY